jgi:hypothetical protein
MNKMVIARVSNTKTIIASDQQVSPRIVHLNRLTHHADPTARAARKRAGRKRAVEVLPAGRQLVTETMGSLDDRASQVLDALAVANDALDAAPHESPPPRPAGSQRVCGAAG